MNRHALDVLEFRRVLEGVAGRAQSDLGRDRVLELVPEEAEVQVIEQSWKPAHTLRSAARALVSTLEALANLGIWVVVFLLPVLLLVGVPLLVLVWLVRRRRRRRGQAETPQE